MNHDKFNGYSCARCTGLNTHVGRTAAEHALVEMNRPYGTIDGLAVEFYNLKNVNGYIECTYPDCQDKIQHLQADSVSHLKSHMKDGEEMVEEGVRHFMEELNHQVPNQHAAANEEEIENEENQEGIGDEQEDMEEVD